MVVVVVVVIVVVKNSIELRKLFNNKNSYSEQKSNRWFRTYKMRTYIWGKNNKNSGWDNITTELEEQNSNFKFLFGSSLYTTARRREPQVSSTHWVHWKKSRTPILVHLVVSQIKDNFIVTTFLSLFEISLRREEGKVSGVVGVVSGIGLLRLILQALGCIGDVWLVVESAKRTFFLCGGPQFESSSCIGRTHDLIGIAAGSNTIWLLLARNCSCYVLFDQLMNSVNVDFLGIFSALCSIICNASIVWTNTFVLLWTYDYDCIL